MKKFLILLIPMMIYGLAVVSCGSSTTQKPDTEPTVKPKDSYDRMKDTKFENVMAVLRETLDAEKVNNDSTTKLNTAQAYLLLVKFLKTDKDRVIRSGMTSSDIDALVANAKENANSRVSDITKSVTAPQKLKSEAQNVMNEINSY